MSCTNSEDGRIEDGRVVLWWIVRRGANETRDGRVPRGWMMHQTRLGCLSLARLVNHEDSPVCGRIGFRCQLFKVGFSWHDVVHPAIVGMGASRYNHAN